MAQNTTPSKHQATQMAELALERSGQNTPDVSHGTVVTANNQAAPARITSTASAGTAPATRTPRRFKIYVHGKKRRRAVQKRREALQMRKRMGIELRELFELHIKAADVQHHIQGGLRETRESLRQSCENLRKFRESLREAHGSLPWMDEIQHKFDKTQRALDERQRILDERKHALDERQHALDERQRVLDGQKRVLERYRRVCDKVVVYR